MPKLILLFLVLSVYLFPPADANEGESKPETISCVVISPNTVRCGKTEYNAERLIPPKERAFWMYVGISAGLVLTAGLIAGLTLGLMSQDQTNLEITKRSGSESDKKKAAAILPLVKKHHLLLVTLLLINASANEALPLFLDNIVSPFVNIILSVTMVLLFGEIIPQAACSRHSLTVGAFCAPLVWVLIYVTFPISYPIAKILDCVLGVDHGTFYHRAELKELVQMHTDLPTTDSEFQEEGLTHDECTIIRGAIDMKMKTAGQVMTAVEKVEMVDFASFLNRQSLQKLHDRGHSRIPVFMGTQEHVIGLLLTKQLIMVNPDEGVAVRDLKLRPIPFVPSDKPLYDMLNLFQAGRSHMAMVVDTKDHVTVSGVITLEDVIEELIQEEIIDETDHRGGAPLPPGRQPSFAITPISPSTAPPLKSTGQKVAFAPGTAGGGAGGVSPPCHAAATPASALGPLAKLSSSYGSMLASSITRKRQVSAEISPSTSGTEGPSGSQVSANPSASPKRRTSVTGFLEGSGMSK